MNFRPPDGLFISGICPQGDNSVLLISPDEPAFWGIFRASPEFSDGARDPLDRWSKRVIRGWGTQIGGSVQFPSDGPPYPPIFDWALRSGECWQSPVGMLVHHRMGLFISFRAAVIIPQRLPRQVLPANPCIGCLQFCIQACPAQAFDPNYKTEICHDFLDTAAGANCMEQGCAVRRACPISKSCGRLSQQSAWHMRHFHP